MLQKMDREKKNRKTINRLETGMTREEERRHRKQCSRLCFAVLFFILFAGVVQSVLLLAVFMAEAAAGTDRFSQNMTFDILLSALSMYGVAFPVSAALMRRIPKWGSPQRQIWGISQLSACFVIAVGIGFAGNVLGSLCGLFFPGEPGSSDLAEVLMGSGIWVNLAVTVLLAPVAEELLFRKLLIDRLLGFGDGIAILLSGFLFALAHGTIFQFFYTFGIGVLWAYIYAKTGRVGYTIGLHMAFNFFGGVVSLELAKGTAGLGGEPWFLKALGQILGVDFTFAVAVGFGLLTLAYLMFMIACFAGGIVILAAYRKRIRLNPGERRMSGGKAFCLAFLNPGMVCCVLVLLVGLIFLF